MDDIPLLVVRGRVYLLDRWTFLGIVVSSSRSKCMRLIQTQGKVLLSICDPTGIIHALICLLLLLLGLMVSVLMLVGGV